MNATNYCNESNIMDWECGLEELKRNFSDKLNSIYKRISLRTYSIRNPFDNENLWLNCNGSDTKDSFYAIKSCLNVLHSLNYNSQPAPIVINIKMTSNLSQLFWMYTIIYEDNFWQREGFIILNKCANLLQCDWAHRKSWLALNCQQGPLIFMSIRYR